MNTDNIISSDKILIQVEKICNASLFISARRLTSFLRYICTKMLEGRENEIKEYTIAVDAFGLPPSFDQQYDPRVRVEAMRLRKKLEQYYLGCGREDEILIRVPKGSYVPVFSQNGVEAEYREARKNSRSLVSTGLRTMWCLGMKLIICQTHSGGESNGNMFAQILISELTVLICEGQKCDEAGPCANEFQLDINTLGQNGNTVIYFILTNADENRIIWTNKFVAWPEDSQESSVGKLLNLAQIIKGYLDEYRS